MVSCSKGNDTKGYLAKVNTASITEADVKEELNSLPPQIRDIFLSEGGTENFIDELIKKELLYQEARKRGFENSDAFKKKLEAFKKLMLIELLLEDAVEKKVSVSEKEVRDFYEKNKADFVITDKGKKKEAVEFERVREILTQRLIAEKQKETFDSYLSGLRSASKIELNKENIARLSKPKP